MTILISSQLKRYAHATRTAISYQFSVFSYQLSVFSFQLSAIYGLSAVSYQPSAISKLSLNKTGKHW
ncbi:hypothetical protein, partial [Moorena sp. SIO3B2]|uniref:hypothetical protein n=1 Tax=Moorena sp. SIO3B2 TaxID=2607827 RepID=UPI0013C87FB9